MVNLNDRQSAVRAVPRWYSARGPRRGRGAGVRGAGRWAYDDPEIYGYGDHEHEGEGEEEERATAYRAVLVRRVSGTLIRPEDASIIVIRLLQEGGRILGAVEVPVTDETISEFFRPLTRFEDWDGEDITGSLLHAAHQRGTGDLEPGLVIWLYFGDTVAIRYQPPRDGSHMVIRDPDGLNDLIRALSAGGEGGEGDGR